MAKYFNIKLLFAFDIISVLLFAMLANLLFSLEFDFKLDFNYWLAIKVALLTLASILFFMLIKELEKLNENAKKEYYLDTPENQATSSIEDRFKKKLENKTNSKPINIYLNVSVLCLILYFFLYPTIEYFIFKLCKYY